MIFFSTYYWSLSGTYGYISVSAGCYAALANPSHWHTEAREVTAEMSKQNISYSVFRARILVLLALRGTAPRATDTPELMIDPCGV